MMTITETEKNKTTIFLNDDETVLLIANHVYLEIKNKNGQFMLRKMNEIKEKRFHWFDLVRREKKNKSDKK